MYAHLTLLCFEKIATKKVSDVKMRRRKWISVNWIKNLLESHCHRAKFHTLLNGNPFRRHQRAGNLTHLCGWTLVCGSTGSRCQRYVNDVRKTLQNTPFTFSHIYHQHNHPPTLHTHTHKPIFILQLIWMNWISEKFLMRKFQSKIRLINEELTQWLLKYHTCCHKYMIHESWKSYDFRSFFISLSLLNVY